MTDKLKLELSVTEINTTLSALGQMPYIQVAELIGVVKSQAESQLQPQAQPQSESVQSAPQFLQE